MSAKFAWMSSSTLSSVHVAIVFLATPVQKGWLVVHCVGVQWDTFSTYMDVMLEHLRTSLQL